MTPPDDDSPVDPMDSVEPSGSGGSGEAADPALDVLATNRDGRAAALTVISPLPRIWVRPLKLLLWIKSLLGPDKMLRRLEFIHVAHWHVIDHFPGEDARTRYAYLLFMSNFNGSWRDYIDDFATVIAPKMTALWGSSFGFPGARPPRPFTDYVRSNDKTLDHYYSAYPQASTTEVVSALRVESGFGALTERCDPHDLERLGDDVVLKAWEHYLATVQRDL